MEVMQRRATTAGQNLDILDRAPDVSKFTAWVPQIMFHERHHFLLLVCSDHFFFFLSVTCFVFVVSTPKRHNS